MPYHLAFYHLDCVRRRLDPDVKTAFIPELSCSGVSRFHRDGPEYTWSSEIYFDEKTFLQKKEIRYVIDRRQSCSLRLTGCPHMVMEVKAPSFRETNGFPKAQTTFYLRSYGRVVKWWGWESTNGRHAAIDFCSGCFTDAEITAELIGHQMHVRYTCYSDLGSAADRSMPKWIYVLTGAANYNRRNYAQHYHFIVYSHVWRTAEKLGRPNLHLITFGTPEGEFVVAPAG